MVNDGSPLVEVVLDGLVALVVVLGVATLIVMAVTMASFVGHAAGIVNQPGATSLLVATSAILLLSTALSVLASIAAQHLGLD